MAGIKGRSGKKLGIVSEVLSIRVEGRTVDLWNELCREAQATGVSYPGRPLLAEAIELLAQKRGRATEARGGAVAGA